MKSFRLPIFILDESVMVWYGGIKAQVVPRLRHNAGHIPKLFSHFLKKPLAI